MQQTPLGSDATENRSRPISSGSILGHRIHPESEANFEKHFPNEEYKSVYLLHTL